MTCAAKQNQSTMNEPTKMETLLGGASVAVNYIGGNAGTVEIIQLPIRKFPTLLAALDDENKQAELYCDKPEGWSDTLTPESHENIVAEGERINADFFERWARRRLARRAGPGRLAHHSAAVAAAAAACSSV